MCKIPFCESSHISMVEHSVTGTNYCWDAYLIMLVVRRLLTIMFICRLYTIMHAYLIIKQASHVFSNLMHLAIAIMSGKKNEVVRLSYALLTPEQDFNINMNRQLIKKTGG